MEPLNMSEKPLTIEAVTEALQAVKTSYDAKLDAVMREHRDYVDTQFSEIKAEIAKLHAITKENSDRITRGDEAVKNFARDKINAHAQQVTIELTAYRDEITKEIKTGNIATREQLRNLDAELTATKEKLSEIDHHIATTANGLVSIEATLKAQVAINEMRDSNWGDLKDSLKLLAESHKALVTRVQSDDERHALTHRRQETLIESVERTEPILFEIKQWVDGRKAIEGAIWKTFTKSPIGVWIIRYAITIGSAILGVEILKDVGSI